MVRALTWPAMVPLVASGLRLASSKSRTRVLMATQVELAQPFSLLVHQPFPDGGAVLDHVGADAGLGFWCRQRCRDKN